KNFLQNGVGPEASQKIRPSVAAIRPNTTMSLVISGIAASMATASVASGTAAGWAIGGVLCGKRMRAGRGAGPRPARATGRSLADVLLQPGVDGVVPEHAVPGLEHPVVLVGEVQQLRLDALALQGGEGREALV